VQEDLKATILYVDDEQNNLSAFAASFRRDFKIFTALSADAARKILSEHDIHVLISDQKMPGTPGIELLEDALKKYPQQVRVLLTAYSDFEILKRAVNNGCIFKYMAKPWNDDELKNTIVEAYALYVNNKNYKNSIAEVEQRKLYLEGEIQKLEQILKIKKAEIEKFIDNG
jgi:two-component system, response regulator PhcR